MKVILADHAGACYGVGRALDIACEVLETHEKASTLGPLIHNPKVVSELSSKGLSPVENTADVQGDTLVIRSHGISPDRFDEVSACGFEIIDATCPHVARAQKGAAELAKLGYHVLVVGEEGHPEVESLVAYAKRGGAEVDVVSCAEDVPWNLEGSIGVVVQTTQTSDALNAVLDELSSRGITPLVKDTICSATRDRQKAAADVACKVDMMVVIGGRNSANTTRLAEICSKTCPKTIHIESAEELEPSSFEGVSTVGVTAGASTPESQIYSTIDVLKSFDSDNRKTAR